MPAQRQIREARRRHHRKFTALNSMQGIEPHPFFTRPAKVFYSD